MINWNSHIESKPNVLYGKPVIKNTRIPVDLILEKLAFGDQMNDLLDAYPNITKEDIVADESVGYGITRELVKLGFSVYSISDSKFWY